MEVVNLSQELSEDSDVSRLLIGVIALLPKDAQDKIAKNRGPEGVVVETTLFIGCTPVPLAKYAEALYGQLERMAEERAKELIQERLATPMAALESIQSRMQMLLTTDLTVREEDRWMLDEFGKG